MNPPASTLSLTKKTVGSRCSNVSSARRALCVAVSDAPVDQDTVDTLSRHRRKRSIEIVDGLHRRFKQGDSKLCADGVSRLQERYVRGAKGVKSTPNRVACGTTSF